MGNTDHTTDNSEEESLGIETPFMLKTQRPRFLREILKDRKQRRFRTGLYAKTLYQIDKRNSNKKSIKHVRRK